MFLVFNKQKISSYIILLSTVLFLFGIAFGVNSKQTVETGVTKGTSINSECNNIETNGIQNNQRIETNQINKANQVNCVNQTNQINKANYNIQTKTINE